MSKRKHNRLMVSGGLCVGYERRDRLKVSVPVNGGHFERWMICRLSYQQYWLGMLKIFVKCQFCETMTDFTD